MELLCLHNYGLCNLVDNCNLVAQMGQLFFLDAIIPNPSLVPGAHVSPSLADWYPQYTSPCSPTSFCVLQSGENSLSLTETPHQAGSLSVPRMSSSPEDVTPTLRNMTVNECFQSRSTVLQGQPFGGIPTVLVLNLILWVVSLGALGETQGGLSQGRMWMAKNIVGIPVIQRTPTTQ